MAVRLHGADVEPEPESLAAAYPEATGRLVVFLHGLCENESYFQRHRERTGTTYAEMLAGLGWTPLMLRANTGLPLRENGAALTALVQRVVEAWPVPVTRIALVGHSLGGLVIRAAGAVASEVEEPWSGAVSDVITLGTPHLGAPIAWGIGHGSRGLGRLPETAAFGRILDWRSRGVHDLVAGLAEDVPPLPHARYHLVAATLTASQRHPVGDVVGDLLVRPRSAYGRDRRPHAVPRRGRAARGPDRPLRAAQPPGRATGRCETGSHDLPDDGGARAPRRGHHRRPARPGLGPDLRRLPDAGMEPRAGPDAPAQAGRDAQGAVVPRHQPAQGGPVADSQRGRSPRAGPAGRLGHHVERCALDLGGHAVRRGDPRGAPPPGSRGG